MSKLLFVHRWLGVALALFMALWFGSGLLIVLGDPPAADRAAQLAHAEPIRPQAGWLDPAQAWARGGRGDFPAQARLRNFAGAPYWIFRTQTGALALSALDGAPKIFDAQESRAIAAAWLAAGADPGLGDRVVHLSEDEQAPPFIRAPENLVPVHRLTLEDDRGAEILVSARSGDVLAESSAAQRWIFYAGGWIHTLHPLDGLGENRRVILAFVGGLAFIASLSGMIIGWIRWRPGWFGRATWPGGRTQPYRRLWLAAHFWTGLIGGIFATLWAFSGFLTSNPHQAFFSAANASADELARYYGRATDSPAPTRWEGIDGAVEIVWSRLGYEAVAYGLRLDGARIAAPETPAPPREKILEAAKRLGGAEIAAVAELRDDYDSYYYPSRRQDALERPLPVLRVDLADAAATRLYIDVADGKLLLRQDASRRAWRWLFSAPHHWDLPALTASNKLWYGWMLTWIVLGLTLAVSSIVLGWRRLRMTHEAARLARAAAAEGAPAAQ